MLQLADSFLFTHFDKELARKYAKDKCKTCWGKGYIMWDHPQKFIPEHAQYCQCTVKNIKEIIDFCNANLPTQTEKEERVLECEI